MIKMDKFHSSAVEDDSCITNARSKGTGVNAATHYSHLSDSKEEDSQGTLQDEVGPPESSRNGRQAVYFPLTASMDYNQKLQWTVKLCKDHKDF